MRKYFSLILTLTSILLSLGLLSSAQAAENWVSQTSGTGNNLFSVHFVNADTGWSVGSSGTILKTSNGGTTWITQTTGVYPRLDGVHFANINTGWAVGWSGTILKTTDGGNNWTPQVSSGGGRIWDVYSTDASTAWAAGDAGIIKTTNGGATWTLQNSSSVFYSIYFVDGSTGWAIGNGGTIVKTTNGGATWETQASGTGNSLDDLDFINTDTGWIAGVNNTLINTSNGGGSWNTQTSGTSTHWEGIDFVDENNGWIVGWGGIIKKTTDGGSSWSPEISGTTANLRDLSIVNGGTAWAVGNGGTILKRPIIVNFPDANLELAVRQALNKPTGDITDADMETLTTLSAFNREIVNLQGLEYAVNLTNIDLSINQISEITPLSNLTKLARLVLGYNQISDITPLQNLTNINNLNLYSNQISDLSPLINMNLISLSISYNQISDITLLQNFTNLTYLRLSNNQISDIYPLANLTNLQWLYLNNNEISDIATLTGLVNLKELYLSSNRINDITPLVLNSGLNNGDTVDLRSNYLDILGGSQDMDDINTLISRGAIVFYDPQNYYDLTAEFSFTPNPQDEGADVSFSDESTSSSDEIVDWDWDFGDSTVSTLQNPSHPYADNGTYTVSLTVTDDNGTTDSISKVVTIDNVDPSSAIDLMDQPVDNFILPGHNLDFSGSFSDPGWGDSHISNWDFGDITNEAGTLIEENERPDSTGTTTATHSYSNPGTYTVTLMVADDDLGSTSVAKTVVVSNAQDSAGILNSYIQSLPDNSFSKNADKQRSNLGSKLDEIAQKIADGDYQGAINKLNNNIKNFADGSLGGNPKNDWIIEPESQQEIGDMVDSITAYLETLM